MLMYYAMNGSPECLSLLLQHGSDVHVKNNSGETALILCAKHGTCENMSLLIEYGAKVDDTTFEGGTLLMVACHYLNEDVVRMLVMRADTDVKAADYFSMTAFHSLVEHLHNADSTPLRAAAIMHWLVRSGIPVDSEVHQRTPLDFLVDTAIEECYYNFPFHPSEYLYYSRCILNLIRMGADINRCAEDRYRKTALIRLFQERFVDDSDVCLPPPYMEEIQQARDRFNRDSESMLVLRIAQLSPRHKRRMLFPVS